MFNNINNFFKKAADFFPAKTFQENKAVLGGVCALGTLASGYFTRRLGDQGPKLLTIPVWMGVSVLGGIIIMASVEGVAKSWRGDMRDDKKQGSQGNDETGNTRIPKEVQNAGSRPKNKEDEIKNKAGELLRNAKAFEIDLKEFVEGEERDANIKINKQKAEKKRVEDEAIEKIKDANKNIKKEEERKGAVKSLEETLKSNLKGFFSQNN